jgi:hypothetical protein
MSIYCSIFDFGFDHLPRCKRMRKTRYGYEQDNSKPCTCGSSPIEYQHSGVLPSGKDKRSKGVFGIAAIPDHITRNGRDDKPAKGQWYPLDASEPG